MKKKLLVIGLVFCCVWGVFASKLTDAAASGDFESMKKQIELLDFNVKGDWEVLFHCIKGWDGINEGHKKCIDYLMKRGAVINEEGTYVDFYGWQGYDKAAYMYKMKYDDINRIWCKNINRLRNTMIDGILTKSDIEGSGDAVVYALMCMQYKPTVSVKSAEWDILTGNLSAIKSNIGNGKKYNGQILLFINNPNIIELLEAVDVYELPEYFNGRVCPYLINEIVPKYCTHITTKEQIEFMKFITNYNTSMDYEKSLATVKDFIAKGINLNDTPKILGGYSLFMLPIMNGNIDAMKLLMNVTELPISNISAEYSNISEHWYAHYSDQDGEYSNLQPISVSEEFANTLNKLLNEKVELEAKNKAERERIAKEKAVEERLAKQEQAAGELIAIYMPKFCDNVREELMSYGTMKNGVYKAKNKKFEALAKKESLYNVYRIIETDTEIIIAKPVGKKAQELYLFSLNDGYTINNVQKVWTIAVDQVCAEFGIK